LNNKEKVTRLYNTRST